MVASAASPDLFSICFLQLCPRRSVPQRPVAPGDVGAAGHVRLHFCLVSLILPEPCEVRALLKWNDMKSPAPFAPRHDHRHHCSPGDPGKPERCGDVDRILPTIPILPISYADAEPFLRALGGDDVPSGWQGGLPFTYKIGPGKEYEVGGRVV